MPLYGRSSGSPRRFMHKSADLLLRAKHLFVAAIFAGCPEITPRPVLSRVQGCRGTPGNLLDQVLTGRIVPTVNGVGVVGHTAAS